MQGLATAARARTAVSVASPRARLARGVLPAPRTDSHSRLGATRHVRRRCASAPKSTFWHVTSRREALAVSSGAPHARTTRWGHPTRRTDNDELEAVEPLDARAMCKAQNGASAGAPRVSGLALITATTRKTRDGSSRLAESPMRVAN